ncbi:response regulator [Thermodesulfobacteriota bacterium]
MIDLYEMTVLLVDDMPSMSKFLHKMMRTVGYGRKFFTANSGQDALAILNNEKIDLVLLDYNMPNMSGNEVLSNIRNSRKLRDLSVIMVTAEAYSDFVAEIGESEIDAYILKPITTQVLGDKIAEVIKKANNPPPMLYHLKKARIYGDKGDFDSAIREAQLAMDADPKVTKPIRELGYFYYKKNDLHNAEKWLLKAAEMNDLDVFAFHYLGEVYLEQKNIEKAAYYFDKAIKISPRHLERGINFAKTLVRMKMVPKAIQVFATALELSGSTTELREEIADFCSENEINEYAAELQKSIISEQPNNAGLLFKFGRTLEKLGNIPGAVNHFVRASEIDKENVDIRIHLAKDYLSLNKPVLAERPLREILKSNPDNELAKELLRECV